MIKLKFEKKEEQCLDCQEVKKIVKDTFVCKNCYNKEIGFFKARFDLINEKKILNPENLNKFNNSPYYNKRYFVQELIKSGKII